MGPRGQLGQDVARAAVAAAAGILAVGAVELVAGAPRMVALGAGGAAAFAAVAITVAAVSAIPAAGVAAIVTVACHAFVARATNRDAGAWPGLFADRPPATGNGGRVVHGIGAGLIAFAAGGSVTVALVLRASAAPATLAAVAVAATAAWLVPAVWLGRWVHERTRNAPAWVRDAHVALVSWLAAGWVIAVVATQLWHVALVVFPFHLAASATLVCSVAIAASRWSRAVFARVTGRRVGVAAAVLGAVCVATLARFGAANAPRAAALQSPTLAAFIDITLAMTDADRDGYSSLLGGGDCAPFDSALHPGARDIPGDGIDQNCSGADYVRGPRPSPLPDAPLTAALARDDWNVLIVSIDTLRYDHVGFAGYRRPTTPAIDAIAARGQWFERAYSTSYRTYFVLPSLLTSRFHAELPLGPKLGARKPWRLEPRAVTLAEVLRDAGYGTGMFTAYDYFDGWGVDQGFGAFENLRERGEPTGAVRLTDAALAWLDARAPDERWLAWLHYVDPHDPYARHGYGFGDDATARYDEEIRFVDDQLGRVTAWLEADPARAARTIVVVTSDHGEGLGQHGIYHHPAGLWNVLLHVPLVIAVPGVPPRRVTTPASLVDVAPTIAALTGVAPPSEWTGRAHVAAIAHGRDDDDAIVFATDPEKHRYAAITTGFKLVRDERRNVYQLVALSADDDESRDASAAHPEMRARLQKALIDWRERVLDREVE